VQEYVYTGALKGMHREKLAKQPQHLDMFIRLNMGVTWEERMKAKKEKSTDTGPEEKKEPEPRAQTAKKTHTAKKSSQKRKRGAETGERHTGTERQEKRSRRSKN